MFQERLTSQIVQRVLKEMGIEEFSVGWGFGIVVDIGSGETPCVLLRADMDALPIRQQRAHQFHSHHHGKMHACGHDAHMTMLLGATHILHSLQQNNKYLFPGTIRIIFQPAEEGGAGAKRMSEEGVLVQHPKPSYAFAMHVWPTLPSGTIGFRSGPMLGAADMFTLTIEGVGGHAAFPHLVSDPIVASSAIILNLQTLVSRGMNPLESGVVSVTQVEAGDGAFNVIPAKAVMRGTIRALSDQSLLELREGLVSIATHTALAHGCKLSLSSFSKDHYPVTMNNDMLFPFASKVAGLVSEGGEVTNVDPTMGAEDFAFLAQGVPSAFFFLGQVPTNLGLHHPEFNLDESVLGRGVELFVNLALRALKDLNEGSTL
ncbi:peptidase of the M20/M25/M40 family [Thalassiosira pseudonana CCMP1335]|uniref:Peptidase of the M20/M25/M40 family n=1 Tax=Thalassiosira pseudonana TaxID=35128 RepID=B8C8V4_THAPS|nr:peptidase of the M20/M25/M40 family [Thalassiosira pseudonana CCMP1335]EED90130.1 peptidase of the M20/M25/M40 family [Thalassiosira pseudonana CCMP1335]